MTYFNDSLGERKIMTRDLLRNAIKTKNKEEKIIELPEMKARKIPEFKPPEYLRQKGKSSTQRKQPAPIPFSLLQKLFHKDKESSIFREKSIFNASQRKREAVKANQIILKVDL